MVNGGAGGRGGDWGADVGLRRGMEVTGKLRRRDRDSEVEDGGAEEGDGSDRGGEEGGSGK